MNTIKKTLLASIALAASLLSCKQAKVTSSELSLKDAYNGKFLIGAAMDSQQIYGKDTASIQLIKKHFNSIVAENCMKSEILQPEQGKFDFELADKMVDFGEANNMFIVGHTLVWHSQAPKWIFTDENGNDVSRDTLIERMRKHISTVVGHYKGRVNGWDVVNEAIEDNGEYRQSKWFQIIGEDYIELAFKFAAEADPDAELYYNDYSMPNEGKRDGVIKMVKNLQAKGIRIDAIGMQGHYFLDYPDMSLFAGAVKAYGELGTKVMITELDVSVLPFPTEKVSADINQSYRLMEKLNPYKNGLPDSVRLQQEERYKSIFQILLDHQEVVSRVTLWGVTDNQSWKNYWPVRSRTDYPLLFDRDYKPKNIVGELVDLAAK